ncbi:helix-turn-helix transcriptional regulator [Clostridioides sp. ZZV14-6044]|uniref:helix-turn-helix domain-containing protein n=1 Tax=unclassified Clostridioides TaxID=2635829 RepID=UPI001D1147DB|nr:helix-turn-helix transcriptional regulator [Clostridioides sp. ZZV14-6044]
MTEKLDKLLYSKNITKAQLSKESGIPYTTIAGLYAKGADNIKLSTLKKLADYFQCSVDYLVYENIDIKDTLAFDDFKNLFRNLNHEERELIYKAVKVIYKKKGKNYIGD